MKARNAPNNMINTEVIAMEADGARNNSLELVTSFPIKKIGTL